MFLVALAFGIVVSATPAQMAPKEALLDGKGPAKPIAFALREIRSACRAIGARPLDIAYKLAPGPAESFLIVPKQHQLQVSGPDVRGIMYGLLDVAEQVRLTGAVKGESDKPFLPQRNFKFNLPLSGSAYLSEEDLAHNKWFYDLEYWRAFMAMMARNRYNAISFWSAHPYAHLVRLKKYPEACTLSDAELAKNQAFFHKLFGLAREHGLDLYIVTWNIHVSEGFKQAHKVTDGQDSPLIRDYEKECVKVLLKEYPEITGLGTCPGEAMPGGAQFREDWIRDVYLDTQKANPKPFILRYWGGEPAATAKMLAAANYQAPVMLDIKFNGEHMYSSTKPHVLDKAWQNQKPRPYQLLWHLRNDDIFQLRWGEPNFASATVKSVGKNGSAGFVMGSEIEIPGIDRNHTPQAAKHKTWKYEFEKNWMRFAVWGRLGYNPNEPESLWVGHFESRFGKKAGKDAYLALKTASKIIPLVTSFHWNYMNGDWYPEGNVGSWNTSYEKPMTNFRDGGMWHDIRAWVFNQTIDGSLQSIPDAAAEPGWKPRRPGVQSPGQVAQRLGDYAASVLDRVRSASRKVTAGKAEWACFQSDVEASAWLGSYYGWKVGAAGSLMSYLATGEAAEKARAVKWTKNAAEVWASLAAEADWHYKQHEVWLMGQFSWGKYLPDARRDVEIVRNMKPWPRIDQTWHWSRGEPTTFVAGYDAAQWCKDNARTSGGAQVLAQWVDRFEKRALAVPKPPAEMKTTNDPSAWTPYTAKVACAGIVTLRAKDVAAVVWNGKNVPFSSVGTSVFAAEAHVGANRLAVLFSRSPSATPVARFDFTPGAILIEAESGELTAPFKVIDFPGASGKAIHVPIGAGRGEDGGKVLEAGYAKYVVAVPSDGDYVLRARCWWKNTSNNSLFVAWDDARPAVLGNDEEYGHWHWVGAKPIHLAAGRHILIIRNRDENSVLDCMMVQKAR